MQLEIFEGTGLHTSAAGSVGEDVGADVVRTAGTIVRSIAADGVFAAVEEWIGADIVD